MNKYANAHRCVINRYKSVLNAAAHAIRSAIAGKQLHAMSVKILAIAVAARSTALRAHAKVCAIVRKALSAILTKVHTIIAAIKFGNRGAAVAWLNAQPAPKR